MSARFTGEEAAAPIQKYCENCGGGIPLGSMYYEHDDIDICTECAERYAWALFETAAKRAYAAPDTPHDMR